MTYNTHNKQSETILDMCMLNTSVHPDLLSDELIQIQEE